MSAIVEYFRKEGLLSGETLKVKLLGYDEKECEVELSIDKALTILDNARDVSGFIVKTNSGVKYNIYKDFAVDSNREEDVWRLKSVKGPDGKEVDIDYLEAIPVQKKETRA